MSILLTLKFYQFAGNLRDAKFDEVKSLLGNKLYGITNRAKVIGECCWQKTFKIEIIVDVFGGCVWKRAS